jgi:hypothetical protein
LSFASINKTAKHFGVFSFPLLLFKNLFVFVFPPRQKCERQEGTKRTIESLKKGNSRKEDWQRAKKEDLRFGTSVVNHSSSTVNEITVM